MAQFSIQQSLKAALTELSSDRILACLYNYFIANPKERSMKLADLADSALPNLPSGFKSALAGRISDYLGLMAAEELIIIDSRNGTIILTSKALQYIIENEPEIVALTDDRVRPDDADDWAPLPVEPTDTQRSDTLQKVEALVDRVRGDNGFAANDPTAHSLTVSTLERGVSLLKSGRAVATEYAATLAKPVLYLAKRFGDSAMGKLAEAALAAIREWLPF